MGIENILLMIIGSLVSILQGALVVYISSLNKKFLAICSEGKSDHDAMIRSNEAQHTEMMRSIHESMIALEKANQDTHNELWKRIYSHHHTSDTGEVVIPRETRLSPT